jgi:signal transduction histidine kinase
VSRLVDLLPRPLDPVRSIKLKLGILLVASGAVGLTYFRYAIGWVPYRTSATAILLMLVTSQILAHGMTAPLRQMTAAARAMARGDYTRRVHPTSRDEVGELARAFNHMAADLAAADRQRRELIANVSHELRTPITALQGLLENLVDGVTEPDPARLRAVLAQAERLGLLVTELLDLSRLEAGVVQLAREPIDVGEFLAGVVREAEVTAAGCGRRVDFTVRHPPALGTVRADPRRLQQVFANLLDNAARHSPPGGTVLLTAAREAESVRFEVIDSGTGIPPAERTRVLDRFTGGEATGSRDGGTGLGLAIARWAVELHGGTVAVLEPAPEPAPTVSGGPGCRIAVLLPL